MAWLLDLAGRAENMLNKLDQNAATLVSSQTTTTPLSEIKCEIDGSSGTPIEVIAAPLTPKQDDVPAIEEEPLVSINSEQTLSPAQTVLSGEVESVELKDAHREFSDFDTEQSDTYFSELQITARYKQSLRDAQEQLNMAKEEAERAVIELNSYRTRAQSTLLLKERIIEELRAQDGHRSTDTTGVTADSLKDLEIEQLKQERSDHLAELSTMNVTMEGYKGQIRKLEEQLSVTGDASARSLGKLTEDLTRAESERKELRHEWTILTAEIQAVRTQASKSNQSLLQQLHEKEQEIAGMRKRTSTYAESGGSLENRLKSLTQSLIQKQTTLEEVTADRNSLRIRLEKTEMQHHSWVAQQQQEERSGASQSRQPISAQLDDKAQLPLFKRVVRASDTAGTQLGSLLRRYPLLRILFLVYAVLLHVWVMIVLMSYTPN